MHINLQYNKVNQSRDHPSNPLFNELNWVTFTIPYYLSCSVTVFLNTYTMI